MKKILTRWPMAAALLLALQACATATSTGASSSTPLRDRTTISAEEIEALRLPDLHSVVTVLHPEWLRASGQIGVFVNGVRRGGPEVLASLAVTSTMRVRYLDERAILRDLTDLASHGLATAILVEEGASVALSSPNTTLPGIPAGLHLTVAVYRPHTTTSVDDPLAGNDNYTLQSETSKADDGIAAAARLGYRGIYLQPFSSPGSRAQSAVYDHAVQVRFVARESETQRGVLVGYEYGPLRAGVGVMSEKVTWNWTSGACECTSVGSMTETYTVPMAEVAARVRLWRMLGAELRVTGRQRPDTEFEITHFYDTFVSYGGTDIDVALGLSARVF